MYSYDCLSFCSDMIFNIFMFICFALHVQICMFFVLMASVYFCAFLSFFFWCVSRFLIYYASSDIPITVVHIILNFSVIITTLLAVLIIKTKVHWGKFIIGILFVFIGVFSVDRSIS